MSQNQEEPIQLFEFRLLVGCARIVVGYPRQRFVRVNATTGEPDKDQAWEIGGDMLEAMDLGDDIFPCWNTTYYSNGVIEYTMYHYNDVLAGSCTLTMIPIGGPIPGP